MGDADAAAAAAAPQLRASSLLGGAISSTVALMRRNAKWAPSSYGNGAGSAEDPLLQGFRTLRRQLYAWRDWAAVAPLEYLAPFLAVVRSDETSGPITGAALAALYAVLSGELVRPEAPGATEAMHALVYAVTHCRFEARAVRGAAGAGGRVGGSGGARANAPKQPYATSARVTRGVRQLRAAAAHGCHARVTRGGSFTPCARRTRSVTRRFGHAPRARTRVHSRALPARSSCARREHTR
jgi:hypothetical protein